MAFEPWNLPPLPDSPVAPLQRLRDEPLHDTSTARSSPSKREGITMTSASGSIAAVGGGYVDRYSPNKRSPIKDDDKRRHRAQVRFPSSLSQPISPRKVPLPPSPIREYLSPPKPSTTSAAAAESSFMLPANLSESMIGETSMPTMLMDESLDFGMNSVLDDRGLPKREQMGYRGKLERVVEGSTTPTRMLSHAAATPQPTATSTKPPSTAHRSAREAVSPAKTPSTSRPTRTFPASASHRAVSRCIDAGDISTLLPVSPARTAHLTRDEHQLLRESLPSSEGPSFFLPPPPSSTRKSPRKPSKADMTLDIGDLMAKMAKPKRPSGTEESFEDLLNGPDLEFDQYVRVHHQMSLGTEFIRTMMGNVSFLPAELRLRPKQPVSPIKHTPARIRNGTQVEDVRPSPTKVAEPVSRPSAKSQTFSSPRRPVASPSRPDVRPTPTSSRIAPSVRTPAAAVSPRRPIPATTGRRVSLSTGNLPLPYSASQPKLNTLASTGRSSHVRSGSTTTVPTGASATSGSGLSRTLSSRATTAATASSTGVASLSRPGSSRPLAGASQGTSVSPTKTIGTTASTRTAVPRSSHARTGSTTNPTAPSSRTAPTATTSRSAVPSASTSRPASFRPTSQAQPAKTSLPPTATRPAKSTLPQPGTGPTARSALTRPSAPPTSTSRPFGTDGASSTNRLSTRPPGSTIPSVRSAAIPGKMSMAPPSSPLKRETAASIKFRAASTPAEQVTRGLPKPATKVAGAPATSSRTGAQTTSTIPRPPTSRLPSAAAGTSRLPSAASRNSANILALRARIDALSAKQGDPRR